MWFSLLFFALALNIDALGVGVSYGIKRIRIPFFSMIIICFISMIAISVSMFTGHVISHIVPPELSKHCGGAILIILGSYAVYQYVKQKNIINEDQDAVSLDVEEKPNSEPTTLLKIRFLDLMIQVLKEPHIVDMDQSGIISGREAFLLGMALSLDSLGAGMAVSLLGFDVIDTVICVGVSQLLFTYLGLKAGCQLSNSCIGRQIAVLPGIILILLGIIRFY